MIPITAERSKAFFWANVQTSDDCWIWKGPKVAGGYGIIFGRLRDDRHSHRILAHRFAYEILIDRIPPNFILRHDWGCNNSLCVNPAHWMPTRDRRKTTCPRGHELNSENILLSGGKRLCRTCRLSAVKPPLKTVPRKMKARYAVGNALRDKKLFRPSSCQECGSTCRIEGHHEDYSKPLEVQWLCKKCHAKKGQRP